MLAHDKASSKAAAIAEKPLTTAQQKALINDELVTFENAFMCTENGGLNLIKAARKAKSLGMANDEVVALLHRINNYWAYPLSDTIMATKVVNQVLRWEN